ncbi:hypothetical protein DMUE_4230 [Dictyocoela muelleri]|nr:hypothetical protein DMUE_4230 [Dictyocoela muelleri]
MRRVFQIIYKYINGISFVDIEYELNLNRRTASTYANLTREAICSHVADYSDILGGYNENGRPKIVEIDKCLFLRRKYNRGRITNGQWYVGWIERGSRMAFIVPVNNRNAQIMVEVIINNVLLGTIIMTDKWRVYQTALENLDGYQHATVNHSVNFIDALNPTYHTQNIDGL